MSDLAETDVCEFLYDAIHDTQDIIRAIDLKLHILTAILLLPIIEGNQFGMKKIIITAFQNQNWATAVVSSIACLLWLMSFCATISGICAIINPKERYTGLTQVSGIYYTPGLFSFHFFDIFFCCRNTAHKTMDEIRNELPSSRTELLDELLFEKMKLSYIRDIKAFRQRIAFRLFTAWLLMTVLLVFFL